MITNPFSNKKTTSQTTDLVDQARSNYEKTLATLRDIIAPSGLLINSTSVKLGSTYARTLFILTYPRYLSPG
jgi:hypothetical protein